ncbi:MAG: hypothetical protein H7X80_06785 [bacterium]|nr:hypothetical protein [Candidatus Kapabacteria bacterium]
MTRFGRFDIRNPWFWANASAIAVAAALQFVPLTRELHFEFSAAIALWLSFAVGLAAVVTWWRNQSQRIANQSMQVEASVNAPMEPQPTLEQQTLSAMTSALATTIAPLAIALVHNFITGFCGLVDGLQWYALLVVPSVLIAIVVASLVRVIARRRVIQVLVFIALWSASMLRGAYEALTGPHIFLYSWQVGFFPGGSWDPELPITPLLVLYRVCHLVIAFVLLVVVFEIDAVRSGRSRATHHRAVVAIPAAVVGAVLLTLIPFRSELGLTRTDSWLREELGDSLRTRYATIYYNGSSTDSLDIWRAANYADYHVASHARALGIAPDSIDHITFYAYASGAEQKRLVGTSSASFTKPWRSTLNIAFDRIESTLEHELVHIVLARFGNVLGVSWSNGILEGSAVALEHADDADVLHRHARAAYDFGLAPPVTAIMSSTGFASKRASLSYVLAGSFCRWLIDTYGAQRFTAAYASGSLDEFYGRSQDQLATEYRAFIDELPATDTSYAATINYLYGGGSFFLQRCLRRLATLSGDGYRALAEERYDKALNHFGASLRQGITTGARAGVIRALHGAGRYRELIDSMAVYERDTASHWLLPYRIELTDALAVAQPNQTAARKKYLEDVFRLAPDEWTRLRAALRLIFTSGLEPEMLAYFTKPMSTPSRLLALEFADRQIGSREQGSTASSTQRREVIAWLRSSLVVRAMPVSAIAAGWETQMKPIARDGRVPPLSDSSNDGRQGFGGVNYEATSFAQNALRRGQIDARILSAGIDGRIDDTERHAISQTILSAFSRSDDPSTHASDALLMSNHTPAGVRGFVMYILANGVINPARSRR